MERRLKPIKRSEFFYAFCLGLSMILSSFTILSVEQSIYHSLIFGFYSIILLIVASILLFSDKIKDKMDYERGTD